jgi:glucan phosphoethanolaminetransferase (alkaline phosphatase superfamily)
MMENSASNPAPKILPQKYVKFLSFVHYYNQLLVDHNISTREELDGLSKLWSPVNEQIAFVDSFLHTDAAKDFKKLTTSKKAEKVKKQKDEEKKQKKEVLKKENQKERYITREYKKLIKEFKKNPHKRCIYSAEHGQKIFEKMPHLSDLRDELKEQKDEGLMAYVREHIPIDVALLETSGKT